jgi:single-strand DNA-binding protein
MLIGRLTRDPEVRTFSNGGKVAKFGFAVNNRRPTPSGDWEDEPVFLDVDAFNRGERGKLADRVEQYLRKGQQIFIEGHLKLDQWTSQDGQKRSKITVVVDNFQFLEPKGESGSADRPTRSQPPMRRPQGVSTGPSAYEDQSADLDVPEGRGGEEDIPF